MRKITTSMCCRKIVENSKTNLDEGSDSCPFVSECRDVGEGAVLLNFDETVKNSGFLIMGASGLGHSNVKTSLAA